MTNNFSTSNIFTGDEGFDFILDKEYRGIRNSADSPVSILLKGGPGCGKSTCALQLAQSYVREHKRICVYYALEESLMLVQKRLQTFFRSKALLSILAEDWNDPRKRQEFEEAAQEHGGIIFSRFEFKKPAQNFIPGLDTPWLPFEVTIAKLPEQLDAVKKSMPDSTTPHMVVIDSLNALTALSETSSSKIPRQLLAYLLQIIGDQKFCSVFVFEDEGDFAIEEYLADVVIEFGFSENDKGQRYVRVLKARYNKCSSTTNVMDIVDGVGIQVYPNIELAPQTLKKEFKPIGSVKRFGIPELDGDLKLSHKDKDYGLKPGSTTLLVGEPATKKLPLGLSFLKDSSADEKIMLIALEGREIAINRIGRQVLADKFEEAYKEEDCHVDARYTSPSKLVHDVSVKIHRLCDGNIDRLLFADLDALFERHKEEVHEIITYLINLFLTHGITSVFVYTTSDLEETLNSSIANQFDNIIATRLFEGETSGRRYLGVRVRKYDGISVNRPLRELVCELDSEPIKVAAERGVFKNLVETQPGKVGFGGKLIVRYYSEETDELDDFWNYMKSLMTELFPREIGTKTSEVSGKLEFKPFSFSLLPDGGNIPGCDAVLESVAMGPTQARHSISEILMFDEYWAEWLIKRNRLLPINEIDPNFQLDRYLDKKDYPAMLFPVLKDNVLYGIPLYGNCSLLVYNKELLRKCRDKFPENIRRLIDERGNIEGELKWEEIFDIISKIKQNDEKSKLAGIYIDAFSGECTNGSLLELLWGMGIVDEIEGKISLDRFLSKPILDALEYWNKHYILYAQNFETTTKIKDIPDFIFSRMWYTRFASLKLRKPAIDFGITRIPCLGNGSKSVSLSGNWYIGVLAGSMNEEWATKLAKWLTSYKANNMIARKPIALPTYRAFWQNELVDPVIIDIYRTIKHRSLISHYVHIRPALSHACNKIILAKQIVPRKEIENAMIRLSRELQVIYEQREAEEDIIGK